MFNLSKFSPALKGGASLLPVPASGPGNPNEPNFHQWDHIAGFLSFQKLAYRALQIRRALSYVESQSEGCDCVNGAACDSSCTANFKSVGHIKKMNPNRQLWIVSLLLRGGSLIMQILRLIRGRS